MLKDDGCLLVKEAIKILGVSPDTSENWAEPARSKSIEIRQTTVASKARADLDRVLQQVEKSAVRNTDETASSGTVP